MAKITEIVNFPAFEDIDQDAFEVFLDVDLDQLTVMFFGRHRRHSVHPINRVLSTLEDPHTKAVLGVSFDRFAKQVLVEHPQMLSVAMAATVLAGDEIFAPGDWKVASAPRTFTGRVRSAWQAAVSAAGPETKAHPDVRTIYETTLRFSPI